MCSLIISFMPHDAWPIVIGANRDEMLNRPWDAPGRHWPAQPGIIAGRDRLAGGTWLGLNDHGVIAALLNRTGSLGPATGKASRGGLPLIALAQPTAAAAARAIAALDAGRYRSFNMVIADRHGGFLLRGLESGRPEPMPLEPGLTMVTAGDPNDMTSPRIARYRPAFGSVARPDPSRAHWTPWINLLADRTAPAATTLNVAPTDGFGTVCASLLALSAEQSYFCFAPGPPDRTPFRVVDLTAGLGASPDSPIGPTCGMTHHEAQRK